MVSWFPKQKRTITITDIFEPSAPFEQGGSVRLTIPKSAVKRYGIKDKISERFSYVFFETNLGMLLVPFDEFFNPETIKGLFAGLKFADVKSLTEEDIKMLFEEE